MRLTEAFWLVAFLVTFIGLSIFILVNHAMAATTIPQVLTSSCADVQPWTVNQIWLPPPPNANQGPVPAPSSKTTYCFQLPNGSVILEVP